MSKAVIVFSFEEPKSHEELAHLVQTSKDIFAGEDVKVHMAIKESAAEIISIFTKPQYPTNDSKLVAHARRELELLGETDEAFVESIVGAVRSFVSFGHSGASAEVAKALLTKILDYENLTPLTNDPKEWIDRSVETGKPFWQNKRNSKAFSEDGGATYWILEENPKEIHESKAVKM